MFRQMAPQKTEESHASHETPRGPRKPQGSLGDPTGSPGAPTRVPSDPQGHPIDSFIMYTRRTEGLWVGPLAHPSSTRHPRHVTLGLGSLQPGPRVLSPGARVPRGWAQGPLDRGMWRRVLEPGPYDAT